MTELAQLFQSPFVYPKEHYTRQTSMHEYYVRDAVKYLSTMTGVDSKIISSWLMAKLQKGGEFEFSPPQVKYLQRTENGDREERSTTIFNYIQSSVKAREIIAPTFTTYCPPDETKSILSEYVEENIRLRGVAKHEQFVYEGEKNYVMMAFKEVAQKGRKLSNNALSGAAVSASTVLYNKTSHSTLTSTCRSTSGYGNANNEKFLSGNRHYHNYRVVLNNIIAICNNYDPQLLQAVVDKYGLHLPTAEEAGRVVAYSAQLYWQNKEQAQVIMDLLEKLTPLERAAFVYSGDMYHLRVFNEAFVRQFLTQLSRRVVGEHPDPISIIKKAPESYVNLAHQLCSKEMAGNAKKYKDMAQTEEGFKALQTLACTILNIAEVVYAHRDLIEALWMSKILPASVAYFPESVRRVALTSDTDSTIFTVQEWMQWYNGGEFVFSDETRAIYVAEVFLASSTITHVLATMSANLGVPQKYLYDIQMKSEFTFDVFVPTQLGKHYFACISCQEGNVYDKLKWEIKGAQLRSANAPRWVIKTATEMMKEIIQTVLSNQKISRQKYIKQVADFEREIEASLRSGQYKYLRSSSIKSAGSYAGEAKDSPYQNHYLWNEIFGPKYGMQDDPPYDTYKVSVLIDKPSTIKPWLDSLEDREFAKRVSKYLLDNNKTGFSTFHMPKGVLHSNGIPAEIIPVINYEGILSDICRIFYLILETLGHYGMGDKMKRLLSHSGY